MDYGPGFHGKRTASGETFNQNDLTAAHRTLPLGTKAEVTDVETGKSVQVTINDRGLYLKNAITAVLGQCGSAHNKI